ncbi:hypothetical protein J6590_043076 [Homalodisca vitripennis]|nr:hypothetical protein J6590_043076 [Homalodisca vitripennis]
MKQTVVLQIPDLAGVRLLDRTSDAMSSSKKWGAIRVDWGLPPTTFRHRYHVNGVPIAVYPCSTGQGTGARTVLPLSLVVGKYDIISCY